MLRCSNATASSFRTQLTTSIARRGLSSSSSPRPRAAAQILPRSIPLSLAHATNIRGGSIAAFPKRLYSADAKPDAETQAPKQPLEQQQSSTGVDGISDPDTTVLFEEDALVDVAGDQKQKSTPRRIRKVVARETEDGDEPGDRRRDERRRKDRSPGDSQLDDPNQSALFRIAKNAGNRPSMSTVLREIKWLQDPAALLKRIDSLLRARKPDLAAALLRQAPIEGIDARAGWNSMLNYCFERNDTKAAMRFWNDMKKRGIKPNSHSYTVMLRGLARVENKTENDPVTSALSIYRSLQNKPSNEGMITLIHHNAMLHVCANHLAMDTLWEVAAQLPEEGENSPDCFTYSIILSAIRRSIQWEVDKLGQYQTDKANDARLHGITEGKRVWADVVDRWEKGHLELSNELVSAMAGLLWEGTGDRHLYEVFQLYAQTAGIPLLAKEPPPTTLKSGSRANSRMGTPLTPWQAKRENNVPFVDARGRKFAAFTELESRAMSESSTKSPIEMTEAEQEELQTAIWRPVVGSQDSSSVKEGPKYIQMGNRDLSMIMETCLQMTQAVKFAKSYWEYLTDDKSEHKVVPDQRSFVRYLRILRVARSSRSTVEVIRDQMMPQGVIDHGVPFHIAMSVCRRDRKNLNVFKNANQILDSMDKALMVSDCRALEGYLDLVKILHADPQNLLTLAGLDPEKQKPSTNLKNQGLALQHNLLMTALQTLRPHVAKLEDLLNDPGNNDVRRARLQGIHGVPAALVKAQVQSGVKALAILTQVKQLIDTIMRPTYQTLLKKSDRATLQEESHRLKVVSSEGFVKAHKGRDYFPTAEQQMAYYSNVLAPREKSRTEQQKIAEQQAHNEETAKMAEMYTSA